MLALAAPLLLGVALVAAGSIPQDPFAHPRFKLEFINDRPIARSHADTLLARQAERNAAAPGRLAADGAAADDIDWFYGGNEERLLNAVLASVKREGIDGSDVPAARGEGEVDHPQQQQHGPLLDLGNHTLTRFLLPPSRAYLCLLPPPPAPTSTAASPPPPPPAAPLAPSVPAGLLKHLEGTCLYTKAGWFSYAYCHGREVRQFREAPREFPPDKGGWVPKIDGRYDDYILGRATVPPYGETFPPPSDPSSLKDKDGHPIAPITQARGAGARYLSTRWGGGTLCDVSGEEREIEVQFHCSQTGTDSLGLIKEVSTCNYVLRLETPRLCAVPGFSSEAADGADGQGVEGVGCREILEDGEMPKRTVEGSETSKDRTPLPSWALLPAPSSSPTPSSPETAGSILNQRPEAQAKPGVGAGRQALGSLQGRELLEALLGKRLVGQGDASETEGQDAEGDVADGLEAQILQVVRDQLRRAAEGDGTLEHDDVEEGDVFEGAATYAGKDGDHHDDHALDSLIDLVDLDGLTDDEYAALLDGSSDDLVWLSVEEDPDAEGGWRVRVAGADELDLEVEWAGGEEWREDVGYEGEGAGEEWGRRRDEL